MGRQHRVVAGLVFLVLAAGSAGAAVLGELVYVGGFVSQGYLNTADHNYLIPNTREGSGEFNEAAVHVSAQPRDDLHVGLQLLGRDFGMSEDPSVVVDWAYGDYRWRDALGVRAGKIKLPLGLYNQGRDVDMLRTTVLLPQSVYSENDRELMIAYEGMGLYGNLPAGEWGEFDYEFCYGSLNVPERGISPTNEQFREDARALAPAIARGVAADYGVPADSVTAALAAVDDLELQVPWIAGGSLIWTAPLSGLRLGGSFFAGDVEATGSFRYDVFVRDGGTVPRYVPRTLEIDEDLDLHSAFTGSLEYTRGGWILAGEFARMRFGDLSDLGWYASNRYRFDRHWSVAAVYSEYYPNKNDRDGDALVAAGKPAHGAWQRDLGLSVRYDVNDHWLVKLEYHAMDGTAMVIGGGPDAATDTDRYWRMIAAKTTFHF